MLFILSSMRSTISNYKAVADWICSLEQPRSSRLFTRVLTNFSQYSSRTVASLLYCIQILVQFRPIKQLIFNNKDTILTHLVNFSNSIVCFFFLFLSLSIRQMILMSHMLPYWIDWVTTPTPVRPKRCIQSLSTEPFVLLNIWLRMDLMSLVYYWLWMIQIYS